MTLDDALRRWGLTLDGVPREAPNGNVAFVRRGDIALVLKVVRERGDERHAAAALRHFDGRGCVRLLMSEGGAILVERAQPGDPLSSLVYADDDDAATGALCDVIAALHSAPRSGVPNVFPSVEQWGRGFARHHASVGGSRAIDAALLDRAETIYSELAASQEEGERRLLHGDLHHDNVLRDGVRGWLAIDPKGVIGERAYELGAALRNPWGDATRCATPAAVERRTRLMAERLGLDRRRVVAWAFAQAVLSAVWSVEDGESPRWALTVAEAIDLAMRSRI